MFFWNSLTWALLWYGALHGSSGTLGGEPAGDGENHRCKSGDSLQAAEKIPHGEKGGSQLEIRMGREKTQ
jgi:hypothetical protein